MTMAVRLHLLSKQRLDNLAHLTGRTKSYYLCELFEVWLMT